MSTMWKGRIYLMFGFGEYDKALQKEEDFFAKVNTIVDTIQQKNNQRRQSDLEEAKKIVPEYLHKYMLAPSKYRRWVLIDVPGYYSVYVDRKEFVAFNYGNDCRTFDYLIDAFVYAKKMNNVIL